MIEFFKFSWPAHLVITFIFGISILMQTVAIMLSFFGHNLKKSRIFENLFEISILFEIFIFSLMHGEVIDGYKNGFLVASGYEKIRIIMFLINVSLAVIVYLIIKSSFSLMVIPATIISLPIIENLLGSVYPWFFIAAIILFLGRSIVVCISNIILIRTKISALSVIRGIDILNTGVLFSENDGYILLSNKQMQKLMLAIADKIFRNSIQFYEMLVQDKFNSRCKKEELDGQMVYLLPDDSAWMFTKTEIQIQRKNYIHISASDVSQVWKMTVKLQNQDKELRHKSDELKKTISKIYILSKKKEIENAKMRAHDILGQRLSLLLRIIQDKNSIDYDLLVSLSKGLLDEVKAERETTGPYDKLNSIQQVFSDIGVNVKIQGQFPYKIEQASLFVDIIRESATNAVRHGFATQINIKSELIEGIYNLTIDNNGYTTNTPIIPGSGIQAMREKIKDQDGYLDITHHPVFTLSVVLPGGDKNA